MNTTNSNLKKYEGKSGELSRFGNPDEYLYFFDIARYFPRTSLIQKVEYEDCNTQKSKILVVTLNSVYQFEVTFSKKYLLLEEVLENIVDIKDGA